MKRIAVLVAAALFLAGCFVFDNPWDMGDIPPSMTFQIVVQGGSYAGTYMWNSTDNAYEAMVGSDPFYVFMDSTGYWCLASQLDKITGNGTLAHSISTHGALPPTSGSGWNSIVTGVDDSAGGIIKLGGLPDETVKRLDYLYLPSDPRNHLTYRWQHSLATGTPPAAGWTDIPWTDGTYQIQPTSGWIRVTIIPTDSTGTIEGAPVVSQPVFISPG
jgi:hypothetical protein